MRNFRGGGNEFGWKMVLKLGYMNLMVPVRTLIEDNLRVTEPKKKPVQKNATSEETSQSTCDI
jgi:hypothetical protein